MHFASQTQTSSDQIRNQKNNVKNTNRWQSKHFLPKWNESREWNENNKFKFKCIKIWNLISINVCIFFLLSEPDSMLSLVAFQMNSFRAFFQGISRRDESSQKRTFSHYNRTYNHFASKAENVWLQARDNTANFASLKVHQSIGSLHTSPKKKANGGVLKTNKI